MENDYQEKLRRIKRQNESMINVLITVSDDSSDKAISPPEIKSGKETVNQILYRVLKENPYTFKQHELFYEVHIKERRMNPEDLKIERYLLQRSDLCKKYGWGFHGNEEGKIALIPCDSAEYRSLLSDYKIKKKKAYNISR